MDPSIAASADPWNAALFQLRGPKTAWKTKADTALAAVVDDKVFGYIPPNQRSQTIAEWCLSTMMRSRRPLEVEERFWAVLHECRRVFPAVVDLIPSFTGKLLNVLQSNVMQIVYPLSSEWKGYKFTKAEKQFLSSSEDPVDPSRARQVVLSSLELIALIGKDHNLWNLESLSTCSHQLLHIWLRLLQLNGGNGDEELLVVVRTATGFVLAELYNYIQREGHGRKVLETLDKRGVIKVIISTICQPVLGDRCIQDMCMWILRATMFHEDHMSEYESYMLAVDQVKTKTDEEHSTPKKRRVEDTDAPDKQQDVRCSYLFSARDQIMDLLCGLPGNRSSEGQHQTEVVAFFFACFLSSRRCSKRIREQQAARAGALTGQVEKSSKSTPQQGSRDAKEATSHDIRSELPVRIAIATDSGAVTYVHRQYHDSSATFDELGVLDKIVQNAFVLGGNDASELKFNSWMNRALLKSNNATFAFNGSCGLFDVLCRDRVYAPTLDSSRTFLLALKGQFDSVMFYVESVAQATNRSGEAWHTASTSMLRCGQMAASIHVDVVEVHLPMMYLEVFRCLHDPSNVPSELFETAVRFYKESMRSHGHMRRLDRFAVTTTTVLRNASVPTAVGAVCAIHERRVESELETAVSTMTSQLWTTVVKALVGEFTTSWIDLFDSGDASDSDSDMDDEDDADSTNRYHACRYLFEWLSACVGYCRPSEEAAASLLNGMEMVWKMVVAPVMTWWKQGKTVVETIGTAAFWSVGASMFSLCRKMLALAPDVVAVQNSGRVLVLKASRMLSVDVAQWALYPKGFSKDKLAKGVLVDRAARRLRECPDACDYVQAYVAFVTERLDTMLVLCAAHGQHEFGLNVPDGKAVEKAMQRVYTALPETMQPVFTLMDTIRQRLNAPDETHRRLLQAVAHFLTRAARAVNFLHFVKPGVVGDCLEKVVENMAFVSPHVGDTLDDVFTNAHATMLSEQLLSVVHTSALALDGNRLSERTTWVALKNSVYLMCRMPLIVLTQHVKEVFENCRVVVSLLERILTAQSLKKAAVTTDDVGEVYAQILSVLVKATHHMSNTHADELRTCVSRTVLLAVQGDAATRCCSRAGNLLMLTYVDESDRYTPASDIRSVCTKVISSLGDVETAAFLGGMMAVLQISCSALDQQCVHATLKVKATGAAVSETQCKEFAASVESLSALLSVLTDLALTQQLHSLEKMQRSPYVEYLWCRIATAVATLSKIVRTPDMFAKWNATRLLSTFDGSLGDIVSTSLQNATAVGSVSIYGHRMLALLMTVAIGSAREALKPALVNAMFLQLVKCIESCVEHPDVVSEVSNGVRSTLRDMNDQMVKSVLDKMLVRVQTIAATADASKPDVLRKLAVDTHVLCLAFSAGRRRTSMAATMRSKRGKILQLLYDVVQCITRATPPVDRRAIDLQRQIICTVLETVTTLLSRAKEAYFSRRDLTLAVYVVEALLDWQGLEGVCLDAVHGDNPRDSMPTTCSAATDLHGMEVALCVRVEDATALANPIAASSNAQLPLERHQGGPVNGTDAGDVDVNINSSSGESILSPLHAINKALFALLRHRSQLQSESCMHSVGHCIGRLLHFASYHAGRRTVSALPRNRRLLSTVCDDLSRLFSEMAKDGPRYSKYAPYVLSTFMDTYRETGFAGIQKRMLFLGVFELFKICSVYELDLLVRNLDSIGKELFKSLYNQYKSEHQFKGKA